MTRTKTYFLALLALACLAPLAAGRLKADDKASSKHLAVARKTFDRLLAAMDRPEGYDEWPPRLDVLENADPNAYATIDVAAYKENKKFIPVIVVHTGEVEKVAEFDPEVLALTLGHELGHLYYRHVIRQGEEPAGELAEMAFSRQHEIDADLFGVELALKAGFTRKGVMRNLVNSARMGSQYSSYEGYSKDHPAWKDRMALMDKDRAALWRSMSAFDTAVFFLATEQYENAENCLLRVTREFPDCAEAWANLGYAQLMRYCDKLEDRDLVNFDLGQIVVGGFYRRSESFESKLRGVDAKLWWDAVGALRVALRLNPNLVLAKANLAVAYMMHPEGNKDVGMAAQLFDEVAETLKDPTAAADIDPTARLALQINSGVAHNGHADSAANSRAWAELAERVQALGQREDAQSDALVGAVRFNRAAALGASSEAKDRQLALQLWTEYLARTPQSAAWWNLAYEHYAALCKKLEQEPKSRTALASKRPGRWRAVTDLRLDEKNGNKLIALATDTTELVEMLGKPDGQIPVLNGQNLRYLRYDGLGIRILAAGDVLGIVLSDPSSPHVQVRGAGLASETHDVYVGMPREEFEKLFGADRPWGTIDDPKNPYRFYQDLGLAVRFRGGKVAEIAIAPLTRSGRAKG